MRTAATRLFKFDASRIAQHGVRARCSLALRLDGLRDRLPGSKRRGLLSVGPLLLPYKILELTAAIVKAILKTITPLANFL